ncbi:MAG: chemotaxis protein CheA, partial [Spirochaetes bacterium]|nr:chemotaxis protein CheA [Spirochaetota bacterium]
MSDFIDDDLLKDYFDEAFSQVDVIEKNILILEKNIKDKDAIDSLFRAAHTLKGGSATVRMDEITSITHALEDVMDEIRSGKIKLNTDIIDILLNTLDIIKNMVDERRNGSEYNGDYSDAINNLNGIVQQAKKTKKSKQKKVKSQSKDLDEGLEEDPKFEISEYDLLEIIEANSDNLPLYKVIVCLDETNPMRTVGGIQIFTALRDIAIVLKTVPEFNEIYSDVFYKDVMYVIASDVSKEKIKEYATIPDATEKVMVVPIEKKEIIKGVPAQDIVSVEQVFEQEDQEEIIKEVEEEISLQMNKKVKLKNQKIITSSILRVESSRIDSLLNLVSEIVINKASFNQIGNQFFDNFESFNFNLNDYKDKLKQFFEKIPKIFEDFKLNESSTSIKKEIQGDFYALSNQFDSFISQYKSIVSRYKTAIQNLDRISSSLQEGVMKVRMVPVKQIFDRLPRLIRDLSRELKKDVELVVKGEDTEIDKVMIDDLIDPFIHIVRNSIDHGFESPEEREALNKPNPAILEISAMSEGNMINIYVSDDGKGIDVEEIRKKAIENNLISPDVSLKEQDSYNLIFEPGFSTAQNVTSVSGRGVGLDVVKKNIEKLNGTIRVSSEHGMGTMFSIKIPLTLAIIQGLMVQVNDEVYAIPISSILESVRIKIDDIKSIDNYE